METSNLNIGHIPFSFNELIDLVKQLSDKEKKQLKAFLKKESTDIANGKNEGIQHPDEVGLIMPEKGDNDEMLKVSDFSFIETRELLKDSRTSFSDEVIAERREAI